MLNVACYRCRTGEEKQYDRHKAIATKAAEIADPSAFEKKTPSKRPEVLVTSKDIGRVASTMDQVFNRPIAGNVEAPDNVVEEVFQALRNKKWKPTKTEAELCPDAKPGGDNASLKRHARVCAAFSKLIFCLLFDSFWRPMRGYSIPSQCHCSLSKIWHYHTASYTTCQLYLSSCCAHTLPSTPSVLVCPFR